MLNDSLDACRNRDAEVLSLKQSGCHRWTTPQSWRGCGGMGCGGASALFCEMRLDKAKVQDKKHVKDGARNEDYETHFTCTL